jgi:segregation and condensation protein A
MKQPPETAAPSPGAASAEEADARAYRVTLPMFEGPLDLLLHLIQKHELNILEIPIGFVAQKYLEYIRMMEDLSIDIASEYLVMAATLTYLKSRSLLPPDPTLAAEEDNPEEEEDPRAELIRKLLEYQKYKHAADTLGHRELLGRDVFARGFAPEHSEDEAPLAPMSLFKLMDAFEGVLKRAKQVQEHQIDFEKVSISDRIGQIVDRLRVSGTLQFVQLFDGDVTRVEMVVTFLALLEMTKLRITRLFQDGPLMPIVVELALAPGELHEFETQRKLGETPSVMQKIDAWDESRVEIPVPPPADLALAEEAAFDEQSLANFELTPEELGEDNEWAQDLAFVEGGQAHTPLDGEDWQPEGVGAEEDSAIDPFEATAPEFDHDETQLAETLSRPAVADSDSDAAPGGRVEAPATTEPAEADTRERSQHEAPSPITVPDGPETEVSRRAETYERTEETALAEIGALQQPEASPDSRERDTET